MRHGYLPTMPPLSSFNLSTISVIAVCDSKLLNESDTASFRFFGAGSNPTPVFSLSVPTVNGASSQLLKSTYRGRVAGRFSFDDAASIVLLVDIGRWYGDTGHNKESRNVNARTRN